MKTIKNTLILYLLLALCNIIRAQPSNSKTEFNYIEFKNDSLFSTHAIKYSLKIPHGFNKIAPKHYQPVFNGHPFNVSYAAIEKDSILIMVHAEMVADGSGFLDYSYLKPEKLNGLDFYVQENCIELNEKVFERAADLAYIKENGFDFGSAIYLKQFFTNSTDGNYEFVLSYGKKVCNCDSETISIEFIDEFNRELENTVKLNKAKSKN